MVRIAIFLVITVLALAGCSKENTPVSTCGGNLKMIGAVLNSYSGDYAGHYPPDFETLVSCDYTTAGLFKCKRSDTPPAKDLAELQTGKHCDYVYTGAGLTWSAAENAGASSTILAYCIIPGGRTHHAPIIILFADWDVGDFDESNIKMAVDNHGLFLPGYNMPKTGILEQKKESEQAGKP